MTGRNYLKTTLLLAGLSGLLLAIGAFLGGNWLTIMLIVAIGMNGIGYFFSDKIAIRAARAVPVTEAQFPELYQIVKGLADRAQIPMPRLYVSPSQQPTDFNQTAPLAKKWLKDNAGTYKMTRYVREKLSTKASEETE